MLKLLLKIILFAVGIFFTASYIDGISIDNITAAFIAGIAIILVNTFIKPVVKIVCLPINFMTLGLFSIIINLVLMSAVIYFVPGINSADFLSTILMAFVLSLLSIVLNFIL